MPAIVDKMIIDNEKLDKRVKLSTADKLEIIDLHTFGIFSQRELAQQYFVSRRLISFVLFPDRLEKNIELRAARGGSKAYYNKDAHTIAMASHRKFKRELFRDGKIS